MEVFVYEEVEEYAYLCMEYANGGELLDLMHFFENKEGSDKMSVIEFIYSFDQLVTGHIVDS